MMLPLLSRNTVFNNNNYHFFDFLSRGGDGVAGSGWRPLALMRLYYDAGYQQAYMPGRVVLAVGSPLYLEVKVHTKDRDIVTVLEDCYATNTNNASDPVKQLLIQNK